MDKAFKGALKFSSVRHPLRRAISGFYHSKKCGKHCAMCWKNLDDPIKWARTCSDVHDAQYDFIRGSFESIEDIMDDYDLILVTERYWESLVVLRHILGIPLNELLFVSEAFDADVILSSQPQRFLDILAANNAMDIELYNAASVCVSL